MGKKNKHKYIGSFADVLVGKSATFGFKQKSFKTMKAFAKQALKQAWIPVSVKKGHRMYDAVNEVHGWLRFDCDVRGEKETIISVLESKRLAYICLPSTNYNKKDKNYKWHISVPVLKQSNDVVKYKWQMKQALIDLGVDLHDRRVTEVCVQNFNPFRNGESPEEGWGHTTIKDGNKLTLKKPPKDLHYSEMTKTLFNGKGSNEVIPKKVTFATENIEVLHPTSGINIENVGWVQLKDLNLDVGGMIGGLSCPSHNSRHNNGKGGHQVGYAFATMNEGGDVWINCTGAECQGKSYKIDYPDYGADTKLSDLFELRKLVSLSAFNYEKNSILNAKADGSYVMFRWADIFEYWDKELFFKLSLDMTDANFKKMGKLIKKRDKAKSKGNVGVALAMDGKINQLKLDNEYEIIESAFANKKQFEKFKARYQPTIVSEVITEMPHEKYISTVVENIGRFIKTEKQHDSMQHHIDPFILDLKGQVKGNKFEVTTNKLLPDPIIGKPSARVIEDYLDHNPFLPDIINMIMAQRYGADKKSSYLWLKADSDWGKSFLFEGMFKGLGYCISESETKNAIKGDPSGLSINDIIKSSFLFFDEFKSAVSELKNIATEMHVTEKFKGKQTVPVYMKIFASAEEVQSLNSSIGMESQFANRFLYMEAKGSLLERDLYKRDMDEYKRSVKIYVNQELHKLKDMYDSRGRVNASKLANEVYSEMITKYSIKSKTKSVDKVLPEKFKEWVAIVKANRNVLDDGMYKDVLFFNKDSVYILNLTKCKDVFTDEFLDKKAKTIASHKNARDIVGKVKKSSIKIKGAKINCFKI